MRIVEAQALFGTLNQAKITLDEGLTVLSLPNEAGKSTWCAFFRAMLYGMPQRERSTASNLAEKEKYRPWKGGEDAFGRMVVFYKERNIVLERTFSETGRTKEFKAYYQDTGFDVSDLNEDNCGQVLCGIGREAYEKSGFISHNSMESGDSGELERKIQALAASGDEETSFRDAFGRLEHMKNEIRLNKAKGLIPRLEAKLENLNQSILSIRSLAQKEASFRAKLLALDSEKEELKKNITLIEEHDAYNRYRKIQMLHAQAQQAQEAYLKAKPGITFSGQLIGRAFLSGVLELFSSVREKKTILKASEDILQPVRQDYEKAALQLYSQRTPENTKKFPAAAYIIAAVVAEAGAVFFASLSNPLISGILAATGAIVLLFGFLRRSAQKKQSILREKRAEAEQAELARSVGDKEIKYQDAQARYEQAKTDYDAARETFLGVTDFLGISGKTQEETANELKLLDQKVSEFYELEHRFKAAKETEAALHQAIDAPQTHKPDSIRPEGDLPDYKNRLDHVNEEYASLFGEASAIAGRMQQVGDLSMLESEREITIQKINRLKFQYSAVAEASEVLSEASEELAKRVSPLLAKKAGDYFEHMTGGKYSKVLIRQGFRELLASERDGKMREIAWFSQGTADQLYLSLRLALCDMVLKSDAPSPLILDDVLISFDDDRLVKTLEVFRQIAEKRQVIVFTCHRRERAYLNDENKGL